MRESASTDLGEPQGSNPLGPPGPELQSAPYQSRFATLNFFLHELFVCFIVAAW